MLPPSTFPGDPTVTMPERSARPSRPSRLLDRVVFLALPAVVLAAILALLWSAGVGGDDVPASVRTQAQRHCSSAPPPQPMHAPGSPGFDRCVADWIAILGN